MYLSGKGQLAAGLEKDGSRDADGSKAFHARLLEKRAIVVIVASSSPSDVRIFVNYKTCEIRSRSRVKVSQ